MNKIIEQWIAHHASKAPIRRAQVALAWQISEATVSKIVSAKNWPIRHDRKLKALVCDRHIEAPKMPDLPTV